MATSWLVGGAGAVAGRCSEMSFKELDQDPVGHGRVSEAAGSLGTLLTDVVELAKERANLRTIIDAFMDGIVQFIPKSMLEQVMDIGKRIIDELIYSIK